MPQHRIRFSLLQSDRYQLKTVIFLLKKFSIYPNLIQTSGRKGNIDDALRNSTAN